MKWRAPESNRVSPGYEPGGLPSTSRATRNPPLFQNPGVTRALIQGCGPTLNKAAQP